MDNSTTLGAGFGFIVILWLIIITVFLAVVAYFAWSGRIEIGPTGPAGPIGPTGPAAVTGVGAVLTNAMNNGLTSINIPTTSVVTTCPTACHTVPVTCPGGGVGAVQPINTTVAICNPCQFYSLNADVSNYQLIPGLSTPTIVRWAFSTPINTSHISYATNGMFILTPGRYQLTATVIYPATNRLGGSNVGGTYKYMAIMLNDANFNNVVTNDFLIDRSQPIAIGLNNVTQLSLSTTFNVDTLRNRLSVLTWHDSPTALEIGTATINNISVASTFHLFKIQ